MEEPKTLSYDWQYGREELFLRVDSYMSDDNLYIGLYHAVYRLYAKKDCKTK